MREPRLGDDIDDFCVRCKRITNHAVVSLSLDKADPAKVRCRTCHSDHDYRHEQAPPPKVDVRKQALFNEVLKKVNPDGVGKEESDLGDDADLSELDEGADEVDEASEGEVAEVVEEEPPPPPKAKAAKGKSRK